MTINDNGIIVLTQPGCRRCDDLKRWLKVENIKYREESFDTEAQTEMIMMNLFGDPPFLKLSGKVMSSSEMFDPDGSIIEAVIRRWFDE